MLSDNVQVNGVTVNWAASSAAALAMDDIATLDEMACAGAPSIHKPSTVYGILIVRERMAACPDDAGNVSLS